MTNKIEMQALNLTKTNMSLYSFTKILKYGYSIYGIKWNILHYFQRNKVQRLAHTMPTMQKKHDHFISATLCIIHNP